MKNKEQNLSDKDIPYQCNFILIPRKEKIEEIVDVSGLESGTGCFSLEKRVQN